MIAIVASFLLVAYLLGPGAIYRVIFAVFIPSKRFQRSRTEEVVFSVFATILPFALAWLLLCHTPVGRYPTIHSSVGKYAAYRSILSSLISGASSPDLSAAYLRALKEQLRFVAVLWSLCIAEAVFANSVVRRYGDLPEGSLLARMCEKLFLIHVSEWQFLFTTNFLPKADRNKVVEVDVLTSNDMLYRGRVADWFTDPDGKLLGLFLSEAARYRRDELKQDREKGVVRPVESYWKPIPGSNLYIQSSSILNYNVRYGDSIDTAARKEIGQDVRVTTLPSEADEDLEL